MKTTAPIIQEYLDSLPPWDGVERLSSLSAHANRRFSGSTELCLFMRVPVDEFCMALGDPLSKREGCIGYLRFRLVVHADGPASEVIGGERLYIFALVEVLPGQHPAPSIVVPWSGVLWSRQAAIAVHQSTSSYQRWIDRLG